MFCKQCGKSLTEGQAFCDGCGAPTVEVPKKPETSQKFHCPHCGSNDLHPITSTEITTSSSGGGFSAAKGFLGYLLMGPFGFLCGSCGSKTKTSVNASSKNYWMCRSCGKKFLDMADLDAQLQKEKAAIPRTIIVTALAAVFSVLLAVYTFSCASNMPKGAPQSMSIIFYALSAICVMLPFVGVFKILGSKKLVMELEQEKAFLEQNAYNTHGSAR